MRKYKIHIDVSELFKNIIATGFDSRYISLLEILENCCVNDE